MLKRGLDILVASSALIAFSPVMVGAAIAIKATSPGPILFRQNRVGRGGRIFQIYKFRSMVADAAQRGSWQTQTGDPRITRVGRILRRTSIDELPQLLNVLMGDMSIVGPRPYVPESQADFSAEAWQERHSVAPGITGLAQAVVRSEGTFEERLALDLDYVSDPRAARDLHIIWLTAFSLFGRKTN